MYTRPRTCVLSTRVILNVRTLIRTLAEMQGVSVSQALNEILIESVRERLVELSGRPGSTRGKPVAKS